MNPIKNGKQVFAVLSMATVMSISMSVKVNAASEIDAAAHTAANAVVQSENKNTSSSNTNVKTNSDASSEKREEVSAIDSKEASLGDKSTVVESADSLEMSDENVGGPVGVEEPEGEIISTEVANPENGTATEKKLADATLNNLNSDENKGAEDKAAGVTSEAKAAEKTQAADENLNLSEGKVTEPQKAPEEANEPNYSDEEKKIKDYSDSERYKTTDLTPGSTIVGNVNTDEGVVKDGFKFDTLNPSPTSPSKTEYGYLISIDKKTGQRTYTKIVVSDSGLVPVNAGDKPMMGKGEKLTPDSPEVTYKPDEDGNISGRKQKLYNYEASEETLKHINSKDNSSTVIGMKDNYTQDNPDKKYFGKSFLVTYKVNPWPNENDKLELMKISGEYNEKVFVQGQDIDTKVKVDNIDANAKDRLVGQVYNPITGKIVPGARAYIGADGSIHIQMPEGALKKNADGKYVVNEESIFNTKDYKGIQNLDVKFFARPRTADEFKTIAETPDDNGETGTYVETGAGTGTINHKGTDVTIDKQGIDRYDHYNLIGKLKLNLDDTRYYDQDFKDQEGNKLDEHTSTKVFPGQDFSVEIQDPKTGAEMDGAYSRGEASGKLKGEFLDIANKQIADDLGVDYKEFITSDDYADKRWTVVGKSDNISKFTIKAPKQAKAGDFLALPVEYTYTNGSTDTHWFHFVVQETNNNRPEYLAEVGPQGNTLVNKPIITKSEEDLKKNQPESYELIGNTFKDNKGNVWNVSIDQTTGAVTATLPAKLPDGKEINGGEKLTVPVKVKYTDQTTGEEKTEEIKAQFIATKQHKTVTNETTTSPIPFETEVEYDESLPEGYFKETQAGQKGELKITFVQDTLNGKKGIFQQDGTFKEGESKIVVETVKEPTKRIIKIGTKPASTKIEIPFDTEYEVDNNLEAGKTELVNDGEKGEVTITTTRNEDGTITVNKNVTKEAKNKKIKIGTKTQGQIVDTDKIPFGYKVEFDPDFYKNYPDATENYKIVTPGKEGENTKTWTIVNSEKVGDPEVKITDPVDAVIKVGQKDYTGTVTNTVTKEVPYKVIIKENPELEAGKSNVKQKGVAGSKTFEYSGEIFNGELKEGTQFTEKEVADKYVAPQDEIIEIGTKPANNEKTYERKVGVEVEYVYDNTKPKGYRNIEDLVPGKVITKVVNKYNPETGEIETTEKIEVIPGKRKVTFGTKDFTGEYEEVVKNINPYKTEIVFDNTLKAGEKVIDQPGENGETVTKTKKHLVNGVVERSDDPVTEETKKVQNQVIRVGTMTDGKHSYTEKLPFKTTVEKVSDLKKGEWRYKLVNGEEQKGKVGSRKTEWTIKNSVVTDTNVVSEEKPVDAIIEIGDEDFTGNVSHEVTEEIPYDVKIVEDPTMIAGKSEVVTEGKTGSKTTKYTQGIKNGEADGELKSEVTAQKNPTHQVIKVGTKPAENNKDYDKEVNVKVEYVYDENLDKGVVKVGELTKGKVEIKTVNKYDPKTGEVTTTEVEEVKEATQKIIVGTKDFTGTYKYEKTCPLPFEVVIKEDPTLAKGEKVVDQEGQAGSKTTYYEQDIKNGQPDGDPKQLNEKINSQPKNHIVRIGTKVAKSSTVKTVDREIPFETKYIYDDTMDAGSEKVESEGKVGKEKVTITTKITDGTGETSEETNTITEKEDRIVRVGVKPVVKEENIPQDTEYKHNSNLKAGETKKISDGTPGKVIITTSFNKETGKLETKVTRTEATPAKYEYGSKTEGKVTVETDIPYEVEFVPDDTMAAGETKVTQEGKLGKKETTITIENSKEVEGSRKEKVTKEPVKKIVKIGTLCKAPTPGGDNTNPGGGNDDPSSPTDSSNSSNPGGNDSGTPGTTTDKPVTPGTPGETPNKPVDPNKPAEPGKLTEEKTPEGKTPEDKKFEGEKKISDSEKSEEVNKTEKAEKSQDEKELVKVEKAQEEKFVANKVINRQVKDDDKAPKTADAGLVTETASAGLASGLLLLLGRRKRRKEEENKKNK
ncbi:G5 domain-containing protein [uncultured Peptoniphilus sp.]|uniref:G5 domain-containing protein n=1 Tax=uncultured Peptoniphilus sp. TaxID=254354 RepID=UPI00258D7F41|nr:G5 domain-containing protein [uncultured Peptoniphilus sp.]MDU6783562.1 G5 domain-containing protein [Peptoniphilus harei]